MLTSIINPLDHLSEIITKVEVSGTLANYREWGWGVAQQVGGSETKQKAFPKSPCLRTSAPRWRPQDQGWVDTQNPQKAAKRSQQGRESVVYLFVLFLK